MVLTKEKYVIDGMVEVNIPGAETSYFFTDEMLDSGVVIEWACWDYDNPLYQTVMTVKILEDNDAIECHMYMGESLGNCQIYHIVKDVYELYEKNTFEDFKWKVEKISDGGTSAGMQSNPSRRAEIQSKMNATFRSLRAIAE
jgi:hypothetical protein